jgi:hypothetical protein
MDDTPCRRFFLEPTSDNQRLYEALRAVFVEGGRQKEVAACFGYSFEALRQQVHQFRVRCAAGQPPPFSARARVGGRPVCCRPVCRSPVANRNAPPSPTAVP